MKIGILYIALGKYTVLWKDFYLSSEKYFMESEDKEYFVFTDDPGLYANDKSNVNIIQQHDMGWPYNTLLRFQMFQKHRQQYEHTDYLFFFNANLEFIKPINKEFLLDNANLLCVRHPGFRNVKNVNYFPYCRQKKSTAYIPYNEGKDYVQGALNGGKTEAFLTLIETLALNVKEDLNNKIIAEVHDESHLNKYILNRNDVKILGAEYVYPEGWELEEEPQIISREKSKYFDVTKSKRMSLFERYLQIKNKIMLLRYGR